MEGLARKSVGATLKRRNAPAGEVAQRRGDRRRAGVAGVPSGRDSGRHRSDRVGWLRAAVLGANDGIVSSASLLLGMATAGASHRTVLLTGVSALVAGAMSMAAGEFISVHSQKDAEVADIDRERGELKRDPRGEMRELKGIYMARGLDSGLAQQVSQQLMAKDALGALVRDELGFSADTAARPVQAAIASAASFSVGALVPLVVAVVASQVSLVGSIATASLLFLAVLGAASAGIGGAPVWSATWRVAFWGAVAMAVTSGAGALFGAVA
jgi:VIT1/CCC1 family predicted Fe2+/Mn2+ transporter